MKELIKITPNENGDQVVSARELHAFLEVSTLFKDWMPRMLDYGFQEDIDFSTFLSESTGGRPSKEYVITLDCAKEVSMIQRTEKGKEARRYFIACEKAVLAKTTQLPTVKDLAQMVLDVENKREEAERKLAIQQPRADYYANVLQNKSFRTVNEIALELNMTHRQLNQKLSDLGVQYKQGSMWHLYAKYRDLGYAKTRTDIVHGQTIVYMVWTEKGRAFIHSLINPIMIKSIDNKFSTLKKIN